VKGEIAIVVLPESQLFCYVSEKNTGKYAQSVRGAYKAFSEAGYQVDFAKIDQLDGYQMVFLPFPLMIESEHAQKLADYVKNGGLLISEGCPSQFGNHGYVRVPTPGYGLDKVFGVKAESGPETVWENPPSIQWNRRNIGCVVHRQRLCAGRASVLAEYSDGGPALTEHSFGAGRAVLIGTYPALSYEWGCGDAGALLVDLAAYLGLTPRAHSSSSDVWVRLHTYNGNAMAYVVNLSSEQREVTVRVSYESGTFASSTDVVSGEPVDIDNNSFTITIDAHDARVIRMLPTSVSFVSSLADHFSGRS
jgi:beta-galactosidase